MNRRMFLSSALYAAGSQAKQNWQPPKDLVESLDKAIDSHLKRQISDRSSPWFGGLPDTDGLYFGGTAGALMHNYGLAYMLESSRHHKSALMLERMKMAAAYLDAHSSPEGNIDNPITNFNSPADTSFMVWAVSQVTKIARDRGATEIEQLMEPVVRRCGRALAKGGIHTPNHRWVLCSALAEIDALYPDTAHRQRIDAWLAEGIDIDSDGQYTERSTGTYNGITNRALTIMALKLNRPDLLDPVRRNLESMIYLLHPGDEVVTDISRRQDLYTAGTLAGYSLALKNLAIKDRNGVFETLSRRHPLSIGDLLEYPHLREPGPSPQPVPDNYVKEYPFLKVARIRRANRSATIMLDGRSRFFSLRNGNAVIEAIRFASAFFGKAQFQPQRAYRAADVNGRPSWILEQNLSAPYWQPLNTPKFVGTEEWEEVRPGRKTSEWNYLTQRATITETAKGFDVSIEVTGPREVPVAIEIGLRPGGKLTGTEPHLRVADAHVLKSGHATYETAPHQIRFGPGKSENEYVLIRGAEPKLPGPCVYITGFTPFQRTIEFDLT